MSPDETLAKAKPFLKQMGITRVANVTGLDRIGVPVVTVVRPNSRSVSISQGKGATLAAAKASGVMEAVESYHAERIEHPLKYGSFNELSANHRLADVTRLARLNDSHYTNDLPLFWIEGHDLITDDEVWVPYETVHSNYTIPSTTDSGCFVASTNGLASGNHILEAMAHGIAEVIERDSNTLWNLLPDKVRARTRLDISTIEDELCLDVIAKLQRADISVGIWDITSDAGVPSFYCLIVDERLENAHSGAGAGCHPTREVALLRAVTEAVQVRTNYITGARDDLERVEYSDKGIEAKLAWARALMSPDVGAGVDFQKIKSQKFTTLKQDVEWLVDQLKAVGVSQVICVDLTRPEFALPVVRIVVAGLEGPDDHDHYCPGERAHSVLGVKP
ncbi:MAG: YcaO-like family protein [Hyphomicrobiales bacterium]|nr:YcaO-like family protein [Hyphomicrobiales bacterium]